MQDDWMMEPFGGLTPTKKTNHIEMSGASPIVLPNQATPESPVTRREIHGIPATPLNVSNTVPSSPVTSVQKLDVNVANWRFLYDALIFEIELSKEDDTQKVNLAEIASEAVGNSPSLLKQLEKDLGISCSDGVAIEVLFLEAHKKTSHSGEDIGTLSFESLMKHVEEVKAMHLSNKPRPMRHVFLQLCEIWTKLESTSSLVALLMFSVTLALDWFLAFLLASYLLYLSVFIKFGIVSPSYRVYIISKFPILDTNPEETIDTAIPSSSPLSLLIVYIEVFCDMIDEVLHESSLNSSNSTYTNVVIHSLYSLSSFVISLVPVFYILNGLEVFSPNHTPISDVNEGQVVQDGMPLDTVSNQAASAPDDNDDQPPLSYPVAATNVSSFTRSGGSYDNLTDAINRSLNNNYSFSRSPPQ